MGRNPTNDQSLNPTRGTGAWEFRDISQLQVGDVVLLNQTYIAPADWLKTDAKNTIYETSLWHHIVFETQRGLFSAWNKTRHDQPLSFFMNLSAEVPDPFHYAVGIHITGYRAPTPTTKPPPPIPLHPSDIIVTINGGSIQKLGNTSYFYGAQPGSTVSGGGTIYTYVNNFGHPDNAIKYLPQFAQIGCYTAFVYVAYIRNNKYDSQSVPIQVQSNNGVANLHENFRSFNDSLGAGPTNRWLSIGNFLFAPNSGNFVLIADDTGEAAAGKVNTSTTVNFDSVKFVYLKPNCA